MMMTYRQLAERKFCQLQGRMTAQGAVQRDTERRDGTGMNDGTVLPYFSWFVVGKATSPWFD